MFSRGILLFSAVILISTLSPYAAAIDTETWSYCASGEIYATLPNPHLDANSPKPIVLEAENSFGDSIPIPSGTSSSIIRCSGSWIKLKASGGADTDLAVATDPFNSYCNGCGNCTSYWHNHYTPYEWKITGPGLQTEKGPYNSNSMMIGDIKYIKLKADTGMTTVKVTRSECSKATDPTPISSKTLYIVNSLPSFERYSNIGHYVSIDTSGIDAALKSTSLLNIVKDDFGIDHCQYNPYQAGCAANSESETQWGVHCCSGVRLASNPTYTSFFYDMVCVPFVGCGALDLANVYDALTESHVFDSAKPGNIKLVNSCTYCGGVTDGVKACTETGHDHMVIPKSELSGIVGAHEWVHTTGLSHTPTDPVSGSSNLMNATPTLGIVTQSQCNSIVTGSANLVWP